MPERIQIRRDRSWKPETGVTVICARRGKWGNPFYTADDFRRWHQGVTRPSFRMVPKYALLGDGELEALRLWQSTHLQELAQADYAACWCGPDKACHVDVLIEMAQRGKDAE